MSDPVGAAPACGVETGLLVVKMLLVVEDTCPVAQQGGEGKGLDIPCVFKGWGAMHDVLVFSCTGRCSLLVITSAQQLGMLWNNPLQHTVSICLDCICSWV